MDSSKIILENIYAAYGTDSGILFGIQEKEIVKAIIDFTIKNYIGLLEVEESDYR